MENNLKHLGQQTIYSFVYNSGLLEKAPNPHVARNCFVKFNCSELFHYVLLQINQVLL